MSNVAVDENEITQSKDAEVIAQPRAATKTSP